ncbi:MAG: phage protease [Desulfobacca sp.]|uniref:phage protease n=1 Tax=Desulfobacca sp. TaxID=2067990 RepID=UPI00404B387A
MKEVLYCQLGDQVPEVIRLLPLGEVALADGRPPFRVTRESLAQILASWRRRGHDLVIDYEHQSLSGQEAPAAGWIKELWAEDDGLYARVAWTGRAQSYLAKKEYRYFSPVVQLNEAREVTDLLQVALTNCPAMSHLEPLVLQQQRSREERAVDASEAGKDEPEKEKMRGTGGQMIEKLRTIFGLEPDAGEQEILAQAIALRQRQEEGRWEVPEEVLAPLGLAQGCGDQEVIQRLTALRLEREALGEELAALRERYEAAEAERLIQEALITKKTTPAELDQGEGRLRRLAKDDPEFFRALILSRRENWAVPGRLFQAEAASPALDPHELKMCEAFGLTPEAFQQQRQQLKQGE